MIKIYAQDVFPGDAVGNFAIDTCAAFKAMAIKSQVFAMHYNTGNNVAPLSKLDVDFDQDLLIYNFSIGDYNFEKISILNCKKVCYFHGITPPDFFNQFEKVTRNNCSLGLKQIPGLKKFDAVFCNSSSSKTQLRENGFYGEVCVVPPIIMNNRFKNFLSLSKNKKSSSDILVVGRLAPHKNVDFVIDIVERLPTIGWTGTLHIVGGPLDGQVGQKLQQKASSLKDRLNVAFYGHVSEKILLTLYKRCAVLVSASDHEGFYVPGLEGICAGLSLVIKRGTGSENIFKNEAFLFDDIEEGIDCIKKILINSPQKISKADQFSSQLFDKSQNFLKLIGDIHDGHKHNQNLFL